MTAGRVPKAGDVVLVGEAASVQFGGDRAFWFSVIKMVDRPLVDDGFVWLVGYQLGDADKAVCQRSIYVQPAGLVYRKPRPAAGAATVRSGAHGRPGRATAPPMSGNVRRQLPGVAATPRNRGRR